MKKILILASVAGDTKWQNYLGVTKHMVPINGEPLIHRTQRLIKKFSLDDVYVICDEDNFSTYAIGDSIPTAPPPLTGNILEDCLTWHYRDYLNKDGITVVLYGDCYYTEDILKSILDDSGATWHMYARFYPSEITGKKYPEMFAWVFDKYILDQLLICSKMAPIVSKKFKMNKSQVEYVLYRLLAGLSPSKGIKEDVHWIDWNDETDDFDFPSDYENIKHLLK